VPLFPEVAQSGVCCIAPIYPPKTPRTAAGSVKRVPFPSCRRLAHSKLHRQPARNQHSRELSGGNQIDFVNGTPISPVQIDTTQAATDTIAYVVTDQSGLTATSTRTVIIEPAATPLSNSTAITTQATTTAQ
jgi:hypothetical protein